MNVIFRIFSPICEPFRLIKCFVFTFRRSLNKKAIFYIKETSVIGTGYFICYELLNFTLIFLIVCYNFNEIKYGPFKKAQGHWAMERAMLDVSLRD